MKQTKLMLLGILIILLGMALGSIFTPAIYANSTGMSPQFLRYMPGIQAFFVIIGLVIGAVGFFQKERMR